MPEKPQSEDAPLPHIYDDRALLANCRIILGVASALILGFALVYGFSSPEAVDPLSLRVGLAGLCTATLVLTFASSWVRAHCIAVTSAVLYILTGWFLVLTLMNQFNPEYTLGLVFTIAAAGFGMIVTHPGFLTVYAYSASSTAATAGFLAISEPQVSPWLVLGTVGGVGLVIGFAARMRTRLTASLVGSERRFRKLSEAAFEAIFITEDDTVVDCNENALILLRQPRIDRVVGRSMLEFFPRYKYDVMAGDVTFPSESSAIDVSGSIIPVEVRVRSATAEGRQLRVIVVRDITDRKRHESAPVSARRQAEEALETKNTILSNVSHEFRTPLAIMLGYAEMLRRGATDDALEIGELIYESGQRLNHTLNLIIELAQLEDGAVALKMQEADVGSIVREVVETHRRAAESKGIRIEFTADNQRHVAVVDRQRIQKVVDYLIDNAVKFTEQGKIGVDVESGQDRIKIAVTDTGIGIGEDFLPHLFEPFAQESSGLKRNYGGLGVGLPVARQMVDLMGGSIEARSSKGKGSTFVVTLPEGRTPAANSQPYFPSTVQR